MKRWDLNPSPAARCHTAPHSDGPSGSVQANDHCLPHSQWAVSPLAQPVVDTLVPDLVLLWVASQGRVVGSVLAYSPTWPSPGPGPTAHPDLSVPSGPCKHSPTADVTWRGAAPGPGVKAGNAVQEETSPWTLTSPGTPLSCFSPIYTAGWPSSASPSPTAREGTVGARASLSAVSAGAQ